MQQLEEYLPKKTKKLCETSLKPIQRLYILAAHVCVCVYAFVGLKAQILMFLFVFMRLLCSEGA